MRILLVDDKLDAAFILRQMLNASGHEVIWVRNGAEALNELHGQLCDLIISDILMPTMDGFQFCKNVKADRRLSSIPFFFFTATYTDHKDEEFALALGAARFIRKPMEPEEFLKLVNDVHHTSTLKSQHPIQLPEVFENEEVLKLYNERLVNKLEKKVLDLEREVMERERAEETQANLAKILEISLNELYVFQAESLQILKANRGALSNLGYSIGELQQLTPPDLMIDFDLTSFGQLLRSLQSGEQQHLQFLTSHRRKDGSTYPVEMHLERANFGPSPVFIAMVLDITERIKVQETLRQTEVQLYQLQKMEALGKMSAGIAHDFNNILGAILGCTELALRKVSPQNEIHQLLNQQFKAAIRAKDLVKQLLIFCRQVEHKRQPVKLHVVVKEALTLLEATLPSTIEIRESLASQSTTVLADSTQIHQVLMNLCTNAAYAMQEKGGVLEVRVEPVEITDQEITGQTELKPGPYVRLSVHDTGHGISPEIQNRVFEPFFTTKDVGEGTGMGLAVVHGIISSHDGVISVESDLEQGTSMVIYLPRLSVVADSELNEGIPIQPKQVRVLFIDDEEPLAQLGGKMLEELGHEVLVSTNSTHALKLFQKNPDFFDVVITDQTMPHLTGEMLGCELRKIRPNLPIILCTGYSHIMTPKKAEAMGLQAYLVKPILIQELALSLQQIILGGMSH